MRIVLFFVLFSLFFAENTLASCKKTVAYYSTVVYGTPVTYQVYKVCPCSGTWGSPSCNCPNTYITTNCDGCGTVEREYNRVPGHWDDDSKYEVFYDTPDVYPSPYAYHEDWAYVP
jgi:hypothetical protein